MSVNVLYLGMAWDIMTPLLLIPELDNLFVLNILDKAYGTWEQHKDCIRKTLLQGNDNTIAGSYWFEQDKQEDKEWKNVHELAGPAEITSDKEDKSVWKLKFNYNGKERNLIYYYNFNFASNTWPEEIHNIHHYIWTGSYAWNQMIEEPEEHEPLREMLVHRSASESYVYALSFDHRKFPEHIWIYSGHERCGQSIAKMRLDFSDPDWWKENYTGGDLLTNAVI